ncbi:hypothetical protein K439DRAFT_1507237 [Ramaria rubella]|nr:hypothetical protein K439DRAFT_1507237 [Ramaria rubella]
MVETPQTMVVTTPLQTSRSFIPYTKQLRVDLIDKWKGRVKDIQTAKKFLETNNMVVIGEPYNIHGLSTALLHIAQSAGLKATTAEGIRAVALLITESSIDEAKAVAEEINTATSEMNTEHAKMLQGMASALSALDKATKNTTTHRETNGYGNCARVAREGHLNGPPDLSRLTVLAKNSTKARQVLVDEGMNQDSSTPLASLEPMVLVAKANIALAAITDFLGEQVTAVSANKLWNGGIVYELDLPGAAQLIREDEDICRTFLEKFSANVTVRPRLHPVIIERVPLSFNPDNHTHLPKARWIKPVNRREPNQRAAHIIAFVTNPRTANRMMRDGVRIAQTMLRCHKLLKEPMRCLKCHKIEAGHLASNCPEQDETCGMCGGSHRTKECGVMDRMGRYCANCRQCGHAAWDRGCPAFAEKFERFTNRIPENQYRYYPVKGDNSSWEKMDGMNDMACATPLPADTARTNPETPPYQTLLGAASIQLLRLVKENGDNTPKHWQST